MKRKLIYLMCLTLFVNFTALSQDAPMQGYKTMNVKVKNPMDKKQTITITSETAGDSPKRLIEIVDAIKLCEEILTSQGFNLVLNSQASYVANVKDDTEYFKTKDEQKIPNKDTVVYAKPEPESYYVMNFSIDYLQSGITIPHHMLNVTIYESKSKKVIATGQVEDYRNGLINKFEKHIKRFLSDLDYK